MDHPIITHCTQAQMKHILMLRGNGNTYKAIAKNTKRGVRQIERYERVFTLYGITAFAKKKVKHNG